MHILLYITIYANASLDQAIAFHKSFVQMMEQFTTALYDDLHGLRKEMAQTTRDLKIELKEAVDQVHEWRAATNEGFESVNERIQVIKYLAQDVRFR